MLVANICREISEDGPVSNSVADLSHTQKPKKKRKMINYNKYALLRASFFFVDGGILTRTSIRFSVSVVICDCDTRESPCVCLFICQDGDDDLIVKLWPHPCFVSLSLVAHEVVVTRTHSVDLFFHFSKALSPLD